MLCFPSEVPLFIATNCPDKCCAIRDGMVLWMGPARPPSIILLGVCGGSIHTIRYPSRVVMFSRGEEEGEEVGVGHELGRMTTMRPIEAQTLFSTS